MEIVDCMDGWRNNNRNRIESRNRTHIPATRIPRRNHTIRVHDCVPPCCCAASHMDHIDSIIPGIPQAYHNQYMGWVGPISTFAAPRSASPIVR